MTRNFIVSDLHGRLDIFNQIIATIEDLSNGNYRLFYLGDACDRGPDGYLLMLALLNNKKVVYIKGNHEDLFVASAKTIVNQSKIYKMSVKKFFKSDIFKSDMIWDDDINLHIQNGGMNTIRQWVNYNCDISILQKLNSLPIKISYANIDMCHAGTTKEKWEENDELFLLNDREHFDEQWFDNRILVHGHTPTLFLSTTTKKEDIQPIRYNNKIDIDLGVFSTNKSAIYDIENDNFIILKFDKK